MSHNHSGSGHQHGHGGPAAGHGHGVMGHGSPMTPGWARGLDHEMTRTMMHGAAVGGAAAATAAAGRGTLSRFIRHPLVLLTLGAVAGWYIHKYRNEIIAAASQVTDAGKDFVLSQKENLEDMVAAAHEAEETTGKPAP